MTAKLDLVKACLSSAELLGFGPPSYKTGADMLLAPKSVTAMVGGAPKLPKCLSDEMLNRMNHL